MTAESDPPKISAVSGLALKAKVQLSAGHPGVYRIGLEDERVLAIFSGREYSRSRYPELLNAVGASCGKLVTVKQAHTADLFVLEDLKSIGRVPVADGIVTGRRGVAVGVQTADCIPLFFYDSLKQVVAVVHGGWKGVLQGIVGNTVEIMGRRFGCRPSDLLVTIGPCIRFCCYEVGAEFKHYFPQFYKWPRNTVEDSKAHVDLPGAAKAELFRAGVPVSHIFDTEICTACRNDLFFSFRRGDGEGRILSLMALLPF